MRRIEAAKVALRKESVDRNILYGCIDPQTKVALRKESVDRNNLLLSMEGEDEAVALRKESVDRNTSTEPKKQSKGVSLSARRAWIEILCPGRRGGKDQSLSARRAWIEICGFCRTVPAAKRRSPQGERG